MTSVRLDAPAARASVERTPRRYASRRSWPVLIFLAMSLGWAMFQPQFYQLERGGFTYYLAVFPALLLPFARPLFLIEAGRTKALMVVMFGITAAAWHFTRGDINATIPLLLLTLGMVWMSSNASRIQFDDFYALYAVAVVAGIAVSAFTNLNE